MPSAMKKVRLFACAALLAFACAASAAPKSVAVFVHKAEEDSLDFGPDPLLERTTSALASAIAGCLAERGIQATLPSPASPVPVGLAYGDTTPLSGPDAVEQVAARAACDVLQVDAIALVSVLGTGFTHAMTTEGCITAEELETTLRAFAAGEDVPAAVLEIRGGDPDRILDSARQIADAIATLGGP